jgi:hypothetical protein
MEWEWYQCWSRANNNQRVNSMHSIWEPTPWMRPVCSGLPRASLSWLLSYPVFMPKPCTHHMHDPVSIVPHIWPKEFTDNQMSWIKYNYYISNVSKDYDWLSTEWNSGRLHSSTGTTTGATRSIELLIEEFQSIFSFWAAGLSSKGK